MVGIGIDCFLIPSADSIAVEMAAAAVAHGHVYECVYKMMSGQDLCAYIPYYDHHCCYQLDSTIQMNLIHPNVDCQIDRGYDNELCEMVMKNFIELKSAVLPRLTLIRSAVATAIAKIS